ncbi:MAG TPA: sigma factor-like helix-turn-helix DNA-binding protein [Bryobacteraceae bacterium]|nr:sigma factor-like helix-turn-helix DNA-binding protein [Bryobacteraceae bacterium]
MSTKDENSSSNGEDDQLRLAIETALTKIPPQHRAAVILRDIEDLSYFDIAEILQEVSVRSSPAF